MSEFDRRYPEDFRNFKGVNFEAKQDDVVIEEKVTVKPKRLTKKEHQALLNEAIEKKNRIIAKRQAGKKANPDAILGRFGPGPYNDGPNS